MSTHKRLALLAPLLLLAACTDNRGSVQLRHICAPPEEADSCSFADTCDAVSLSEYFFAVGIGSPHMWLFVEVENQLLDNGEPELGRVNTNDAYVQETLITYEGGGLDLADASYRLQQLVPAGTSRVISLYPVPDATATELAGIIDPGVDPFDGGAIIDVVANVRLKGIYGDGTEFETGVYEVPLRLCADCIGSLGCPTVGDLLYTCPPGAGEFVGASFRQSQSPISATCVTP